MGVRKCGESSVLIDARSSTQNPIEYELMDVIQKKPQWLIILCGVLLLSHRVLAQNPDLAPDDLKFTGTVTEKSVLVAEVSLNVAQDQYDRYRYERHPDLEKIFRTDQAYVRLNGKDWVKLDAAGQMGGTVDPHTIEQLNTLADIASSPFAVPDETQVGVVWKLINQAAKGDYELFTYELASLNPAPDHVNPRYTFIKNKDGKDGNLLLSSYQTAVKSADNLIPVEIRFKYEETGKTGSEMWITGEVFGRNNTLFFRADRPVQGNPLGNVLLLRATKESAASLFPMYMEAAEQHKKLRLYGKLLPFSGPLPGNTEPLPNVQFVTWKLHLPGDPDGL